MAFTGLIPIVGVEKKVAEFALPATVQTHEVAPIGDNLLVITQQESNGLVKVVLDSEGVPRESIKYTLNNNPFQGAHGLRASTQFHGKVWVTLQFNSSILLVDPMGTTHAEPVIVQPPIVLHPPLRGPHVILEDGNNLWVTCKDSGHVAKVSFDGKNQHFWSCSRRPIFVAVTEDYVYAALDESSRIFCLELKTETASEIEIPAAKGNTPVGLVKGPDGYAWFVLLGGAEGGTGTFGRLIGKEITWFQLSIAKTAGLLHLAFDTSSTEKDMRLWLLGSSIGSMLNTDAVFTVRLISVDAAEVPDDPHAVKIAKEDIITLPTQACMAHRVLQHERTGALFVTELGVSVLAHITGNAVFEPNRDNQEADAYALWGLGVRSNRVEYAVKAPFIELSTGNKQAANKRKKITV